MLCLFILILFIIPKVTATYAVVWSALYQSANGLRKKKKKGTFLLTLACGFISLHLYKLGIANVQCLYFCSPVWITFRHTCAGSHGTAASHFSSCHVHHTHFQTLLLMTSLAGVGLARVHFSYDQDTGVVLISRCMCSCAWAPPLSVNTTQYSYFWAWSLSLSWTKLW